ncbi:hypothetical protein ABK040_010471 [Willaertia magna]
MAWECSGLSNQELINNLYESEIIKSISVKNAMEKTDRALFCKPEYQDYAYHDTPLPIGENVTISAPHMHAYCLELLKDYLKPGNRAMDVGSGSGYLISCFSEMMTTTTTIDNNNTKIIGIEYVPSIYTFGLNNLQKQEKTKYLLENHIIEMFHGDGWKGCPQHGPYHAIHVGAAASTLPENLISQLACNGRLVIPVGCTNNNQELLIVDKDGEGNVKKKSVMGVRYVPLVNPEHLK